MPTTDFTQLTNAFADFETAAGNETKDLNTLDGLKQADDAAKAKLDAATIAKQQTEADVAAQQKSIDSDDADIDSKLQAIADAALSLKASRASGAGTGSTGTGSGGSTGGTTTPPVAPPATTDPGDGSVVPNPVSVADPNAPVA